MVLELELAPDIENKFNRLPWCHRASPSTTRHESVKSTDADRLMQTAKSVKNFFWVAEFRRGVNVPSGRVDTPRNRGLRLNNKTSIHASH
jgi:hypothetical protein